MSVRFSKRSPLRYRSSANFVADIRRKEEGRRAHEEGIMCGYDWNIQRWLFGVVSCLETFCGHRKRTRMTLVCSEDPP